MSNVNQNHAECAGCELATYHWNCIGRPGKHLCDRHDRAAMAGRFVRAPDGTLHDTHPHDPKAKENHERFVRLGQQLERDAKLKREQKRLLEEADAEFREHVRTLSKPADVDATRVDCVSCGLVALGVKLPAGVEWICGACSSAREIAERATVRQLEVPRQSAEVYNECIRSAEADFARAIIGSELDSAEHVLAAAQDFRIDDTEQVFVNAQPPKKELTLADIEQARAKFIREMEDVKGYSTGFFGRKYDFEAMQLEAMKRSSIRATAEATAIKPIVRADDLKHFKINGPTAEGVQVLQSSADVRLVDVKTKSSPIPYTNDAEARARAEFAWRAVQAWWSERHFTYGRILVDTFPESDLLDCFQRCIVAIWDASDDSTTAQDRVRLVLHRTWDEDIAKQVLRAYEGWTR